MQLTNFWKGGDFMEHYNHTRQAAIAERLNLIQGIEESEVPYPCGYDSGIGNKGRVATENPNFPERKGRIRPTAGKTTATGPKLGQP